MRLGRALSVALAAAIFAAAAGPARADDPDYLVLGAGIFDMGEDEAGEVRLEYRSKLKWWIFKPFTGVMLTSDVAVYAYGGILLDVYFGRRIVVTPSFAVGAFEEGDGKDLGHTLEFRSQIEIAYRFADRSRLALSFSHISNASLADSNPGAQSLMLSYALPFDRLLGR